MKDNNITQSSVEKLGFYVYLLIDPRDAKVFYVGKGKGRRVLNHLDKYQNEDSLKSNKIRDIKNSGAEVQIDILRHGLISDEAFKIESSLIDYIGIDNLTNEVLGHASDNFGRMSISELEIKYEAKKPKFDENVLLVNINKNYKRNMSSAEILEVTMGNWKISLKKANEVKIVCAVFRGITREVFEVDEWQESGEFGRILFKGKIAENKIRNKYLHKDVSAYWSKGVITPVRYSDSLKI